MKKGSERQAADAHFHAVDKGRSICRGHTPEVRLE
jgi:hypothetical protein